MSFKFSTNDDVSTLHESIAKFVPRYIENRKTDYQKFLIDIEKCDFQSIRDYCHKVVGTAKSYHFHQLEEITLVIQNCAREQNLEGIRSIIPSYDTYMNELFAKYLP